MCPAPDLLSIYFTSLSTQSGQAQHDYAQTILDANWSQYDSHIVGYEEFVAYFPCDSLSLEQQAYCPPNISRWPRPNPNEYIPRAPFDERSSGWNGQNRYYDYRDIDDYWFAECVILGQGGAGDQEEVFPGSGLEIYDPALQDPTGADLPLEQQKSDTGFFSVQAFPNPPVCS